MKKKFLLIPVLIFVLSSANYLWAGPKEDALFDAIKAGNTRKATQLINEGLDVNATGEDQFWTPLRYAVSHDQKEIVELLLSKGADVNARNKFGSTALIMAVTKKEIIEMLLSNGADVNAQNNSGVTALMGTIVMMYTERSLPDQKEILELLLSKGADVNVQDSSGRTALMYAVGPRCRVKLGSVPADKQSIELLISNGANVNATDNSGIPVFCFAETKNIKELLLSKGAIKTECDKWTIKWHEPQ